MSGDGCQEGLFSIGMHVPRDSVVMHCCDIDHRGCSFSPCVCACLYYSLIWSELSTTAMPALMAQLKQYGVRKRCKRSLLQMLFPSNDSMMICCTGLGSVWPLMHFLLGVAMIPTAA
eukprot:scaffold47393_cov20-Tisochrysis_lutea.AAC.1